MSERYKLQFGSKRITIVDTVEEEEVAIYDSYDFMSIVATNTHAAHHCDTLNLLNEELLRYEMAYHETESAAIKNEGDSEILLSRTTENDTDLVIDIATIKFRPLSKKRTTMHKKPRPRHNKGNYRIVKCSRCGEAGLAHRKTVPEWGYAVHTDPAVCTFNLLQQQERDREKRNKQEDLCHMKVMNKYSVRMVI
jgi:hypothetical protein